MAKETDSRSYQPGDLILKSEPFVYVVGDKTRGKRCDYCLKGVIPLKRCSQCGVFYFCGRLCQKGAWSVHKDECLLLKRLPVVPSQFALMMARVILKLKKVDGRSAYEDVGVHRRTFACLMSHVEDIKEHRESMELFGRLCHVLKTYLGPEKLPPISDLLSIFGKLTVNTFGIYDEEMVLVGSGLYLGASILDHSCCPNAVAVFGGPILSVRAIKPIPDGNVSKVSISYIDQIQKTSARRMELEKQYFFTCSCDWCIHKSMVVQTYFANYLLI